MLKNFLAIFIAAVFFTGSASASEIWQPEIKLGILRGVKRVDLEFSAPCVMLDASTRKILRNIAANEFFSVDFDKLKNNSVEIRGENTLLKDLLVMIDGKKYFGGVRIDKKNNSLTVINLAPVEEYLRGVVPEEMSPSFHEEALKAQAVAARSFSLKNRQRHQAEGFDLCATTHCQFFGGADSANAFTDEVIKATRGEILLMDGQIVDTNFHTDSGGMTESVSEVWGTYSPHLQAVEELEKNTYLWKKEFSADNFLKVIGGNIGKLKEINLSPLEIGKSAPDRSTSGRVKSAQFVGTKNNVKLTGNELRSKFSLPSTLFNIKISGNKIIFEGYGYGHGVGMSQNGANSYAKHGWNYKKILAHYYRNTILKKLY